MYYMKPNLLNDITLEYDTSRRMQLINGVILDMPTFDISY